MVPEPRSDSGGTLIVISSANTLKGKMFKVMARWRSFLLLFTTCCVASSAIVRTKGECTRSDGGAPPKFEIATPLSSKRFEKLLRQVVREA